MCRRYALLALLVAACRMNADYGGTSYRCSDGTCPVGLVCVGELCVPPGTPDAAPPDAAAPDGDGLPDAPPPPDAVAPDAAAPDAGPPNIVANPDMEAGLTDWTAFNGTLRTSTNMPHGGTLSIIGCKTPDMTSSLFTVYADLINGAPGDVPYPAHYTASIWVRASYATAELAPPTLHLVLREKGGATAESDHAGPVVSPITTEWVQLTADAIIEQPDRSYLILIVWPEDVPDGTCFAIDDAYVGQIG